MVWVVFTPAPRQGFIIHPLIIHPFILFSKPLVWILDLLKFITVAPQIFRTFTDGSGRDVKGIVIIGFNKFTMYGRRVKCVTIELQ